MAQMHILNLECGGNRGFSLPRPVSSAGFSPCETKTLLLQSAALPNKLDLKLQNIPSPQKMAVSQSSFKVVKIKSFV